MPYTRNALRSLALSLLFAPLLLLTAVAAGCGSGQMSEQEIDALIGAMTLQEKVALMHGARDSLRQSGAGYLPGVPRLGIPELRLADGPAGVRTSRPATAMPAPVALASTFDPRLARAYGRVMGVEGRAANQDVLLAPMVNVVRVPHAGRNFETLGEDPLLQAHMVAEEVRGVQEMGLMATIKHYAANNQENQRQRVSAEVDERTLHEIYLPGFEGAVRAGVASVMAAYNRVNGTYCAEHPYLLTDVLREEMGFEGWVMSDWGATHSTVPSLEAGLDMEMPSGRWLGEGLEAAADTGGVEMSLIDQSVRRILTQMNLFGLLGGSVPRRPEVDTEAHAGVAREIATAGGVLLRNEGEALPLTGERLRSLLVVGPTARVPLVGGGGSARVRPEHAESVLDALDRRVGRIGEVDYLPGIDLDGEPISAPRLTLPDASGAEGLRREDAEGNVTVVRRIDHVGENALPPGTSFTWTGIFTAIESGEYEIKLQTLGGRGSVEMDGERILPRGRGFGGSTLMPTAEGLSNSTARIRLEAGQRHALTVTAQAGESEPMQVRLAWVTPQMRFANIGQVAVAARSASAVLVFLHYEGTEGSDWPTLTLPLDQNALVRAASDGATGPVVVVLHTGAPVCMPWAEQADAILQMWYPGQEGAEATVALLLGEANPGGKLPVTFPRSEEDTPVSTPIRYPGVEGRQTYDEGIFVGYRWYDEHSIEPLFPFGHGLSYTTFAYSDLAARPAGEGFEVSFTVRNTGNQRGAEVAQVYLGPPEEAPVPMAKQHLAGFHRVELEPGEEVRLTTFIGARELSYWSIEQHGWRVVDGPRPLYVGSSSRDIRLRGEIGPGGE